MGKRKTAVVALGGNAISPKGELDTIANQFRNTRKSRKAIIRLIEKGYNLAVTHGNGPQVGNALLRVEAAEGKAPIIPLGICVADTEGGMGYMIEQSLQNAVRKLDIDKDVVTIATQIIVDADDPAIKNPQKYVGGWYTRQEIMALANKFGWSVKEVPGKGWRRVVPSPVPRKIINKRAIRKLVYDGIIVIAAGGGGIPVYIDEKGNYEGVDAVIDKDLASSVLAKDIGAEELFILTDVDQVAINYGKENEQNLGDISYDELKKYYDEGQFPAGSMGPKVKAALNFIESGGDQVIITSLDSVKADLPEGKITRIRK
ncbi:MAG: carbamate kinase [Fidelibacterota bacterium]